MEPRHVTQQIRRALQDLLRGDLPPKVDVCNLGACEDCDVVGLAATVNEFIDSFRAAHSFTSALSSGNLDVDPPQKNFLVSQLKQLHSNLRHLVWQTQAVAGGDYNQQVDFLGAFSEAFNSMIASLRQKDLIQQQLQSAHEELEAQAVEQARVNRHLREEVCTRERAEAQLLLAKEAAEAASRVKTQFLANMSHELRTPLHGLIGTVETLLRGELTPSQRRKAETASRSAESLLAIIGDILDFSKIESGKLDIVVSACDPRQELEGAVEVFTDLATQKGLRLELNVSSDVPVFVQVDPVRLRQILVNLIGNAIKFTDDGAVTLKTRVREATGERYWLLFEVEDTGIGIPQEAVQQIFDPFVQADGGSDRRYGGTGLGLAITRYLVAEMGGELGVRSQLGAGSCFWFLLPCDRHEDSSAAPSRTHEVRGSPAGSAPVPIGDQPRTEACGGGASGSILLVEDHPVNREVATDMLEELGYSVCTAKNGKEAVERASTQRFDAIFMDCQMPEMDGYEATRIIRKREHENPAGGHTPIIALTGDASEQGRQECLSTGMDDFVAKPFRMEQLRLLLLRWVPAETRPEFPRPVDS